MFDLLLAAIFPKLLWFLVLVILDLVGGVTIALFIAKNFQFEKIPGVLTKYVPYVVAWLMTEILSFFPPEYINTGNDLLDTLGLALVENLGVAVFVIICTAAFISVAGHILTILPIPDRAKSIARKVGFPQKLWKVPSVDVGMAYRDENIS